MSPGAAIEQLSPAEKRALLSGLLEKKRARASAAARRKVRPVSFSQRRLWFLDQLAPGTPFYNVEFVIPLPEYLQVDEDTFDRTIAEIVRRHESLRTVFEAVDGEPMQVIDPPGRVRLETLDLRHLSAADQEAEALRYANTHAARPFDLARGPLMRIALVRRSGGHTVVLVMHHIICDGWSMGVFWREFLVIYGAFRSASPSPLPDLTIQYSDFAAWQRRWLQGEVLEEQLRYWKRKLDGLPVLNLPCDRPRPPVQTFRGASHPIHVPKGLVELLKGIGEHEGATLFMILLTAFKVLLCRYAGQNDIAVGSYIANRNRAEVEELIGFFVNTLVMRTDLSGKPEFRDALRRVKETALGAYAHQDMPFETLVEVLQPERDLGRNPLFQVIFQLFNAPNMEKGLEDPEASAPRLEKQTATFDLAFNLWTTGDGLSGTIDYSTDLFDAATVERMAGHFRNLLEGIAKDPWCHIQDLPLLSEQESRRAILEWNATAVASPPELPLMELFRGRVERHPDSVALIAGEERLTYRELAGRVDELARHLQARGVMADHLIGICLERSVDAVVAILAVSETGAAYVPMDPSHPAERREFMAHDAGLLGIIWKSGFEPRSEPAAAQSGLAYVIYTSGSTGRPKGVAVEHRQILNRLRWMWRAYPFAEHEMGCIKTPLTFVDSIWEVWGPLLQGIPVVVVPEETSRDPRALLQLLAAQRVTRLWLVPALLRGMLAILEDDGKLRERLSELRFWVSSGEALSPQLADEFARLLPEATLYNLYGTSEVWDATWHDPRRDKVWPDHSSIGRPIDEVQAWVLDGANRPAPIGVPGELVIGGVGLARGYLNQAELTREKFVPHPFLPEGRVYRTGDAACYLPDGQIEYLGRLDRQVKIRGYRVEPGEIEDALREHRAVSEAAVIAIEAAGGPQLAAYVTLRSDEIVAAPDLINHLSARVPSYMIPATVTFLQEIPKTTSGKVNRLALPAPGNPDRDHARPFLEPKTPSEATAVDLYRQVLGVDPVSADAHFFRDLGGHSLLATRLASRIRNQLGIEIPLQALFEAPTPILLAQVLESFQKGEVPEAE